MLETKPGTVIKNGERPWKGRSACFSGAVLPVACSIGSVGASFSPDGASAGLPGGEGAAGGGQGTADDVRLLEMEKQKHFCAK